MARKKKKVDPSKAVEGGAEMDMTPMIDITFQLIVFFLVANDLTRKEIEEVQLPQALSGVEDVADEKDTRIIINIPNDDPDNPPEIPDIKVKGKLYDLKELERFMQATADRNPREGAGGAGSPSTIYVLIRADRNTPWQHVQFVMQVCAQPHVAIYKMQFATTKRDDGKATNAQVD